MQTHDLPGKTQSDAGAFRFGGIERNKDFFLAFRTDRAAIIRYSDHDGFGIVDFRRDFYFCRLGLQGILHQVDKHLRQLVGIGIQQDIFRLLHV